MAALLYMYEKLWGRPQSPKWAAQDVDDRATQPPAGFHASAAQSLAHILKTSPPWEAAAPEPAEVRAAGCARRRRHQRSCLSPAVPPPATHFGTVPQPPNRGAECMQVCTSSGLARLDDDALAVILSFTPEAAARLRLALVCKQVHAHAATQASQCAATRPPQF
jgi:hypothetical protein